MEERRAERGGPLARRSAVGIGLWPMGTSGQHARTVQHRAGEAGH
jgi:hypothetical protein